MGNSLLKPCHIWSAHSPPAAPSLACGWHWSLNKLTNWPFTTPSLRCSKAALMITQPDTVTGAAEQSLTPPALLFYPNTYCSLFIALHSYTNTTGDLSPSHNVITENSTCSPSTVWVITYFHYIFHAGPIKYEVGYEMGTKSWTSQPLLSCLLSREVLIHTRLAQPTKMGERVKQDDYIQEELTGEFEGRQTGRRGQNKWKGDETWRDKWWEEWSL